MGLRLGGHATQNSDTFSVKFSVFKTLPVLQNGGEAAIRCLPATSKKIRTEAKQRLIACRPREKSVD